MLFKNPTLLYGLFFLIVPIIVHLFQLRKFSKVSFTNVAFLKALISQTRKSRQLKKWLTLLARCAAIACIVCAFAQPFLPGSKTATQEKQTAIYLDNSYSMQATGSKGELYKNATSQLLEKLPADKVFTLFTNDKVFTNTNKQQITNELLANNYSHKTLEYDQVQLKAASLLDNKNAIKEIIMISDFQKQTDAAFPDTLDGVKRELVKLEAQDTFNLAIDTAFVVSQSGDNLKLQVGIRSHRAYEQPVTISLENKGILVAKTSVTLDDLEGSAQFDIELSEPLVGRIYIEDNGLSFDNELYISTAQSKSIKVLSINESDSDFLDRLYRDKAFDYQSADANNINYNLIKEQNLVILNQLKKIPTSLASELNQLTSTGGFLVIIPTKGASGYESLGISGIELNESEKKITTINFNHPLFKGVFNRQISNFQYPNVASTLKSINATDPILKFEDGSSFLYKNNNQYIFTAALDVENSNFQNSPLIVPVFYNMAVNALPISQLYYDLDQNNSVAISTELNQDQIISLSKDAEQVIPRQQAFDQYVLLETGEELSSAGNYEVLAKNQPVANISFNSSRAENQLNYYSDGALGNNLSDSIDDLLYKLSQEENILALWKYFVIGALFFLLCELLILKFVK